MAKTFTLAEVTEAEILLEQSPLFFNADKKTFNSAMRDIKKLAQNTNIPLVEVAESYICEKSHDAQMAKKEESNHPEQIAFAGGAALSSKIPALHLIPTDALNEMVERFSLGIERKGDKSWNALSPNQQILSDKEFVLERIAHVIHHAAKLRDVIVKGDMEELVEGDNHASAIAWAGCFLICAKNALIVKEYIAQVIEGAKTLYDDKSLAEKVQELNSLMDETWQKQFTEAWEGNIKPKKINWIAVPFYETNPESMRYPELKGYRIRYRYPNLNGDYLIVREYRPSITITMNQCQTLACQDAAKFNQKDLPPNYFVGPYQKWVKCNRETPAKKTPDPVFGKDGKWYFNDETWANAIGPYSSEIEAREACKKYGESLETGR